MCGVNSSGNEGLRLLINMGRAISSILDLDSLLEKSAELILQFSSADACVIQLRDKDGELKTAYERRAAGSGLADIVVSRRVVSEVAATKHSIITNDIRHDAPLDGASDLTMQFMSVIESLMCAPVIIDNRVIGIIYVVSDKRRNEFNSDNLETLDAFASQLAVAVENAGKFELEELRVHARDAALGRMAGDVSHSVKNFLNSARVALETLIDDAENSENIIDCASDIRHGIDSLAEYVGETLDSFRESSAASMNGDNVDVNAAAPGGASARADVVSVLSRCARASKKRMARLGVDCEIVSDQGDLPQAAISPVELEIVVYNLLDNAIDALESKESGAKISFRVESAPCVGGDNILIIAADNGCGVQPDYCERIFDRHFTAGKKHGSGIGLHHCRKLLENSGGSIEIDPSPSESGACFLISIPAVKT
jgi:signal transduction histidine kinase